MSVLKTICPHCKESIFIKNCAGCALYYPHFIYREGHQDYYGLDMGHCKNKRKGVQAGDSACVHWEEKEE